MFTGGGMLVDGSPSKTTQFVMQTL